MDEVFARDGYRRVEGALPPELVARMVALSERVLAGAGAGHRAANRSQGSLINVAAEPGYAELIAAPALIEALAGLGFADLRYQSGFLISKPGRSPALFWHQDWWGWDLPGAYEDRAQQIGVMVYLTETREENGALRAVPGSHRAGHPLHGSIRAHDRGLSRVDDPDHPLYGRAVGEVAVTSRPGDVIVMDARTLHGAYPNRTDEERMLITLWYHPGWANLPDPVRAHAKRVFDGVASDLSEDRRPSPRDWPAEALARLGTLVPADGGDAEAPFNRRPDVARMKAGPHA